MNAITSVYHVLNECGYQISISTLHIHFYILRSLFYNNARFDPRQWHDYCSHWHGRIFVAEELPTGM
jgi:hypothetical protein